LGRKLGRTKSGLDTVVAKGKFLSQPGIEPVSSIQQPVTTVLFLLVPSAVEIMNNNTTVILDRQKTKLPNITASCFVFGMSLAQISARRPDILTGYSRGFPQSLQTNSGIVS
jgi:hypothetical protein